VTPVVIDASAGAEIVANTLRGRALARLIPSDAEGWVPEHFYAEVLAVLRRRTVIDGALSEAQAALAVARLRDWHLHRASIAPLLDAAWAYRHNMTAADALYVALAEQLGAHLLTDDHRLVDAPTFPSRVTALRLPPRPAPA
jgi:predicted nucleic acid-binding protein